MINSKNLLDVQTPHVQSLVDSLHLNGFACDLSETGCGKTYCAAAVVRELNVPVFIICPKIVMSSWKSILKEFDIKPIDICNYELLIRGNKKSRYTSYVKVPDGNKVQADGKPVMKEVLMFNKRLPENSLIIYDECHKCKALESSNSELLITARNQGYKTLLLSASAATNPIEVKAFGYVTKLHNYTDHNMFKRNFAVNYGAEWTGKFGTMTFNPESKHARDGMCAIHKYLYNTVKCASRLTKADMKKHFKASHITANVFDMSNTDKINRVYDLMEYELSKLSDRNYSEHVFAIMMEARRKTELLKIPTYCDMILDGIRENMSVVMFLNFTDSITALHKQLTKVLSTKAGISEYGNISISTITGGQSANDRINNIKSFQNDTNRIMIANISAGGVGVSLHDLNGKYSRYAIISPNYSAIQLIQSLGRVDRAESKTESIQKIVYAANTIEERACHRVQARLNNLSLLNDGDMTHGIKFYKHVDFDRLYSE